MKKYALALVAIFTIAPAFAAFDATTIRRNSDGSFTAVPSTYAIFKDAGMWTPIGNDLYTQNRGPLTVPNPSGKPNTPTLPVTFDAKVPKSAAAKAMANKLFRTLPIVGTTMVIADLLPDLADLVGEVQWDPTRKKFRGIKDDSTTQCEIGPSPLTICDFSSAWGTTPSGFCAGPAFTSYDSYGNPYQCKKYGTPVTTSTPTVKDLTLQEVADKIAKASGWPSGGTDYLQDTNPTDWPSDKPKVENLQGPSNLAGPQTTTTTGTGPQQLTTTTTTNYNINYQGDRISYETTTTTNITNEAGETVSQETETTPEQEPLPADLPGLCELYPDILACKKLDEVTDEIPKRDQDIALQDGPDFAGGSCPPDVTVSVNGQSVTVLSTALPCDWIQTYLRPIILLLASISAAFIVVPRAE